MAWKQLKAYFSGTVQGVGFRFTTERIAKRFNVSGYVRNLPDGRVEVIAEGEDKVLEDFLKSIQESQVGVYIRDLEVNWGPSSKRFSTFEITF